MYSLKKPKYKIKDFYKELLLERYDNKKNFYLKSRLISIESVLGEAEKDYMKNGMNNSLYKIRESTDIDLPKEVTLKEGMHSLVYYEDMKKVYNEFFVGKANVKKKGREVYDYILSKAENNLCPYCSHREVKTIDHFFPKKGFSMFAVTPINLLPSCSDCNKDKSDDYQLKEEEILIHPYFDNLGSLEWLSCSIVENLWPITFRYEVNDAIENKILKARINKHFGKFKLSELYAVNAAREFSHRVRLIVREYNSDPKNKIQNFLEDNIYTYKHSNPNSWQNNMFIALQKSEWFLDKALPELEAYYL